MPGSPSISNAEGSADAEAKKLPTVRTAVELLAMPIPGISTEFQQTALWSRGRYFRCVIDALANESHRRCVKDLGYRLGSGAVSSDF
jgi:hypothetical protein